MPTAAADLYLVGMVLVLAISIGVPLFVIPLLMSTP